MKKSLKRAKVAAKKTAQSNPAVAVKDANLIVRLPGALLAKFSKVCAVDGKSMSAHVRLWVGCYVSDA